jgi:hypothetical protein
MEILATSSSAPNYFFGRRFKLGEADRAVTLHRFAIGRMVCASACRRSLRESRDGGIGKYFAEFLDIVRARYGADQRRIQMKETLGEAPGLSGHYAKYRQCACTGVLFYCPGKYSEALD